MSQSNATLANADLPGLLRLPSELRIEVYEYLLMPDLQRLEKGVMDSMVVSSLLLFRHPIVRICRRLRYETIDWLHGKFILAIPFCSSKDHYHFARHIHLSWLNCVDSYTVQCLKGIAIMHLRDRCSSCGQHDGDEFVVEWSEEATKLKFLPKHGCCPVKVLHDKRRAYLARRFVSEINAVGGVTKLNVFKLIRAVEDVGR
jgi:hypothetical protein